MIHRIGVHQDDFQAIKVGEKKVEVRLNDYNKQKIKVGDTIQFVNFPQEDERVHVQVIRLKRYATFTELYQDIPLDYFTDEESEVKELVHEAYDIYPPELEEQWGVLAIYYKVLIHI